MTKATLQKKLDDLKVKIEQHKADGNALVGALQLGEHLLKVWDEDELGIPLEQLFPGAEIIDTKGEPHHAD